MWDFFFLSGELPLLDEIQEELRQLFLQPRNALFFNRSEGSTIPFRENSPGSIQQEIELRHDIVDAAGRRNIVTDDGELTGRDKRVALSQHTVSFNRPTQNALNITVSYFVLTDLSKFQDVEVIV